jgi:hypothetical protein
VKEHYFCNGNDDKAKELKSTPTSFVHVINQKWKETLEGFTGASNSTGIFVHVAKPFASSGECQTIKNY